MSSDGMAERCYRPGCDGWVTGASDYCSPECEPTGAPATAHVVDRNGFVWRVVRDGGMATRAEYDRIVSIGIARLEAEAGPLLPFDAMAYRSAYPRAMRHESACSRSVTASSETQPTTRTDRVVRRDTGFIRCSFLDGHSGDHHWYRSLRVGPWTVRINRA